MLSRSGTGLSCILDWEGKECQLLDYLQRQRRSVPLGVDVVHEHQLLAQPAQQVDGERRQRRARCQRAALDRRRGGRPLEQGDAAGAGARAQRRRRREEQHRRQDARSHLQLPHRAVRAAAGGAVLGVLPPAVVQHAAVRDERRQLGAHTRRVAHLASQAVVPAPEGHHAGVGHGGHVELLVPLAGGLQPAQLALLGVQEDAVAREHLHARQMLHPPRHEAEQLEHAALARGGHAEHEAREARLQRHRVDHHVERRQAVGLGAAAVVDDPRRPERDAPATGLPCHEAFIHRDAALQRHADRFAVLPFTLHAVVAEGDMAGVQHVLAQRVVAVGHDGREPVRHDGKPLSVGVLVQLLHHRHRRAHGLQLRGRPRLAPRKQQPVAHLRGVPLGARARVVARGGGFLRAVGLRDALARAGAAELPAVVGAGEVAALQAPLRERRQAVRAAVLKALPLPLPVAPEHQPLAHQLHRVRAAGVQVLQHRHGPPLLGPHKRARTRLTHPRVRGDVLHPGRRLRSAAREARAAMCACTRHGQLSLAEGCRRPPAGTSREGGHSTEARCGSDRRRRGCAPRR
mmetsp:Transcript_48018/g.121166  ORF Transcript_48018/g.121166 Transcript_48018/m.121166 type:complete len:573 (-) Transcript_48018:508-2226(-)